MTNPPPPFCQVWGLGGAAQNDARREVGKACGWRHPRAPRIEKLFGDERATPAVLAFLRDTKVGKFVSLAALGREQMEGRQIQRRKRERRGPAPP